MTDLKRGDNINVLPLPVGSALARQYKSKLAEL